MALQKTTTTDQGFDADYHRVDSLRIWVKDERIVFDLQTYKDAAARTGGSSPVQVREYELSGPDFTTWFAASVLDVVNQNPQERAYEWLKTQTTPIDFTTGTTDV